MKLDTLHGPLARMLQSNRRRGSVLILVVALLVILSLMGVSFLASARTDRYSAQQNVTNTQIDMLVEGVMRTTQAQIVSDLFGYDSSGAMYFRPAANLGTNYENWDSPATDAWMGARIPTLHPLTAQPSWDFVSDAPFSGGFESPDDGAGYTERMHMRPGVVGFNSRNYPALVSSSNQTYIAADADGDGIADAGLSRLPVSALDGVTYYAAVRVIDNAAAVNVNTAWSRTSDFNATGGAITPSGFFPSHVGMRELLGVPAEANAVIDYRTGGATPDGIQGSSGSYPPDDNGASRTDLRFVSWGDALYMQQARRLSNPGWVDGSLKFRGFGASDAAALAYRFCLINPDASGSALDQCLSDSIYTSAPNYAGGFKEYGPDDVDAWYDDNFDFAAGTMPARALLVTSSPVSNEIGPVYAPPSITVNGASMSTDYNGNGIQDDPLRDSSTDNDNPIAMPAYSQTPCKTSVNTATFEELWRAYWSVMAGSQTDLPPFGSAMPSSYTYDPYVSPYAGSRALTSHPQRMFRNPIRDAVPPFTGGASGTPRLDSSQMLQLRAALAALNTLDMRDGDNDVTSRTIAVTVNGDYKGNKGVYITLYGIEAQPYITEIYVNTNVATVAGKQNKKGYFAIELHNPHPFAIPLKNWRLVSKGSSLGSIYDFGGSGYPSIPAMGYLVIENYRTSPSGNDATYRPGSASAQSVSSTCAYAYVPALEALAGKEVILMRPRSADGTLSSGFDGRNYNENQLYDLVPVDQFDFVGLPAPVSGTARLLHYVRASGNGNRWKFVYPGRYDAGKSPDQQRFSGTQQSTFTPPGAEPALTTAARIGGADANASYSPTFTIQMASNATSLSSNSVGSNPVLVGASGPFMYPFGGFARNGDLLEVPYIGAYRVAVRQDNGNDKLKAVLEINSVTIDAAFADDSDTTDDSVESIGRFVPTLQSNDRYAWAAKIFDYLTVQNPHDDYLPNIAASAYAWPAAAGWEKKTDYVVGDKVQYNLTTYRCLSNHKSPNTNNPSASYFATYWTVIPANPSAPAPIANLRSGVANAGLEDSVPLNGLININTASWKVLSALPMVSDANQNALIARAIAYYRDVDADPAAGLQPHGAFRNFFELNSVPITDGSGTYLFKNAWYRLSGDHDADDADGDFSPASGVDGARNDYEEQNLMINRISNLITTRSDSYTCYVLVQGWRNAGTASAELVTQRRVAFVVDRSGVSPINRDASVMYVPNN